MLREPERAGRHSGATDREFGIGPWGSRRRFDGKVGVGSDKGFEAGVRSFGNFPREAAEEHAEEDDGETPYVCFSRIVGLVVEDFGGEIGIAAYDASGRSVRLAGIMEDSGGTKVDKLYDVVVCHDTIIEFEVAVSEAHFVEVFYAVAHLAEDTVDFWTTHFARHDDREEIKRSKLHNLEGGQEGKRRGGKRGEQTS